MAMTLKTLTTKTELASNLKLQAAAIRLGTGVMVVTDPPADVQSQGLFPPQPSNSERPELGRDRERDMRYPDPAGIPTGPVGSHSCATAARVGRADVLRFAPPTPVSGRDYPSPVTEQGSAGRSASGRRHARWQQASVRPATAGK